MRLVHKIDPRWALNRIWSLEGGVSAQVTGLEITMSDGQTKKLIVRRHGERNRNHNPRVATHEFQLLQRLQSTSLPVPQPYLLDATNDVFPTPYIVLEYAEGQTEFSPSNLGDYLAQMASCLVRIHQVDGRSVDLSFLPKHTSVSGEDIATGDAELDGHIRVAWDANVHMTSRNDPVLLHGDFWPGNVLWVNDQLVAVIDWGDASIGDPLADLANSRLEVLWAFGIDAMHDFTHYYCAKSSVDISTLPHWDLMAAARRASQIARWGLDIETVDRMQRENRWFIRQALARLSSR